MGNILFTDASEQKRIKQLYKKRSDEELSVIINHIYELQTTYVSLKYTLISYDWSDKINGYKIQEYYKKYLINLLSECDFGVIDEGTVLHIYWNLDQYKIDKNKSQIYTFDDYEIL